jgi:hypothetical protein
MSTATSAPSWPTAHILQPGYQYGSEFEIGLDLILDAP